MQFKFYYGQEAANEIVITKGFWSGKIRVFVNGFEMYRVNNRKEEPFVLHMGNGEIKAMYVKANALDYVPQVTMDGSEIFLAPKIKTYQYVLSGAPLLLFAGGALGILLGILSFMLNLLVIRSRLKAIFKGFLIFGVTLLSIIIYIVFAVMLNNAVGNN